MRVIMKKDDAIRKRLHNLVDNADSKMLHALDGILGTSFTPDWENNGEFVEELKQRWNEYVNSGKAYTHTEAMDIAKKALKSVKRRSA